MNQINVTAIDYPRQGRQGIADAVITPGDLVEQTATGFKVSATDGGVVEKIFALANVASGEDYTNAYAAGEMIQAFIALPGDEVYARVAAASAAIAQFANLISDGDGTLKVAAGTEIDGKLVAKALEAVDNSGGATIVTIRCRIL